PTAPPPPPPPPLPYPTLFRSRDPADPAPDTPVMLGVFNLDTAQAAASFKRLATLEAEIASFGHGEPVTAGAAARLQAGGGAGGEDRKRTRLNSSHAKISYAGF